MGDGQGDAVIEGSSHKGGLAQPGVADDGDSLLVDILVGNQVIDAAVQAPGPGADGSAAIRAGLSGLGPVGSNTVAGAIVIRLDVPAVESGNGVTAVDGLLDCPRVDLGAAVGVTCAVVLAVSLLRVHPDRR